MKIAYLGSPEFVVPPLEVLLKAGAEVVCYISQPARQSGRGKVLTDPPLVQFARSKGLTVFQPENINDPAFLEKFSQMGVDVAITASYGQLLSRAFLAIPRRATINIHPSLLPKYRGATPVPSALLDGLSETGVTILFTVFRMDAGNIILQERTPIGLEETAELLTSRLFTVGGNILPKAIKMLEDPSFVGTPQEEDAVTHCRKLKKELGLIAWDQNARGIYNTYRAYFPWPGSYTHLGERRTVITAMGLHAEAGPSLKPGQFWYNRKARKIIVATKSGLLELISLKPEGGKEVSAESFWNGLKLVGEVGEFR